MLGDFCLPVWNDIGDILKKFASGSMTMHEKSETTTTAPYIALLIATRVS